MKNLILFFFVLYAETVSAQITSIPDENFEQALIDLGIDSDGIINAQVLTSDISGIVNLNVSDNFIADLSGIEDFESLEILDCSSNSLSSLDISNNTALTHLNNAYNNEVASIDFSNNLQ